MDKQRLESIAAHPGWATAAEVAWLCRIVTQLQEEFEQLQADHAEEAARATKAEEELDHLRGQLAWARQKSVAWSERVLPG